MRSHGEHTEYFAENFEMRTGDNSGSAGVRYSNIWVTHLRPGRMHPFAIFAWGREPDVNSQKYISFSAGHASGIPKYVHCSESRL